MSICLAAGGTDRCVFNKRVLKCLVSPVSVRRSMKHLTNLEKNTLTMVHQLYQVHNLGVGLCSRPVLVARCRNTVERIAA